MIVDTHVVLWWLEDSPRLSPRARSVMSGSERALRWSIASSWEVAIKTSSGRLPMPASLAEFLGSVLPGLGLGDLAVTNAHLIALAALPFHHRDPFDRMLVAQALVEGLPIVTADPAFDAYGVEIVW